MPRARGGEGWEAVWAGVGRGGQGWSQLPGLPGGAAVGGARLKHSAPSPHPTTPPAPGWVDTLSTLLPLTPSKLKPRKNSAGTLNVKEWVPRGNEFLN